MGLECGWRHAQKRWSWEFEDFEKSQSDFQRWIWSCVFCRWDKVWILTVERCSLVFGSLLTEILNIPRCTALGWGQHSMVSKDFSEWCLSSRVAMYRSQKLINPFVTETSEFACVCVCICICTVLIEIIVNIHHDTPFGAQWLTMSFARRKKRKT